MDGYVKEDPRMSEEEVVVTLKDGRRARLHPVSERLLSDAAASVKKPLPPIVQVEGGREIANESDPTYLAELEEYETRQAMATLDAAMMFGCEMLDGLPDNDDWLEKLLILRESGALSFDDPGDSKVRREFLYLKYVAGGMDIAQKILEISSIREEDVAAEGDKFPGKA